MVIEVQLANKAFFLKKGVGGRNFVKGRSVNGEEIPQTLGWGSFSSVQECWDKSKEYLSGASLTFSDQELAEAREAFEGDEEDEAT